MYQPNPRQYFQSVDEIYKARMGVFLKIASKHIYNKDFAIDAVHDAMVKAVEYFNKHPEKKVREQIIIWLILKACKKLNKYSVEIPFGDTRYMDGDGYDPERAVQYLGNDNQ